MSKYFELLQKLGKDHDVLETSMDLGVEPKRSVPADTTPVSLPEAELEQITELTQRVFLQPGADAPRTVVFAGPEPGNGCSWVCARTGEVLACRVAGSVCIVDANLRSPALHHQFGLINDNGLSDALQRAEPIYHFVRATSRENLLLLPAGGDGENGQVLLSSGRMRLRLSELRSKYDYVLIDVAPLSASNDAVTLGCLADGVILVLKANSSRREPARKAVEQLQAAQAKVLGAVLNQRTFPIPAKIYNKL